MTPAVRNIDFLLILHRTFPQNVEILLLMRASTSTSAVIPGKTEKKKVEEIQKKFIHVMKYR